MAPRDGYLGDFSFNGSVTEGAKVEGGLLTYPPKEGRTLALKFSAPVRKDMFHADAAKYCKDAGLRLPHVQELLDFCVAGIPKEPWDNYSRCRDGGGGGNRWWSASVLSVDRLYAWEFNDSYGKLQIFKRGFDAAQVRCVGPAQ